VLLGKTTSPEYGWKGVTDSKLFGATHNPWKIGRTSGGSSGGGVAAEAVGMGNLAIGTDGAGSVRIPCSFTGLFGLKPTQGRVPLWPPSAQGTLSHIGPMTRSVRDAAMMMNVIARYDARDSYARVDDEENFLKGLDKGVKGLRIAYSPNLGFVEKEKIDRDVAVAVESAVKVFKTLGAKVVEDSPDLMGLDPRQILNAHWQSNVAVLLKSFGPEKRELMDPGLLKAAEVGANLGQDAVVTAIHQRQHLSVILNNFMAKYDLLLTPTMPMTAFAVNEPAAWGGDGVDIGWTPFTLTFNLTRQPAATIPCGLDRDGMPIGLQIVSAHARDALILRAAAAYERVRPIPAPPMAHQV
jgi:aspartyl-tRNA(Asn)/glutamyl-tRNA(Gln) amidotransferase subunit A